MQNYACTDVLMARLRRNVTSVLRESGMSMHALSRAARVGYPIVYEICSGERKDIALSTLCRLAGAIGVTPRDLLH